MQNAATDCTDLYFYANKFHFLRGGRRPGWIFRNFPQISQINADVSMPTLASR